MVTFSVTFCGGCAMADRAGGEMRRRERGLRAQWRHEQSIAVVLATVTHHSLRAPRTTLYRARRPSPALGVNTTPRHTCMHASHVTFSRIARVAQVFVVRHKTVFIARHVSCAFSVDPAFHLSLTDHLHSFLHFIRTEFVIERSYKRDYAQ